MRPLAIDPKITEEFLLAQEGVLDASVWLDDGLFKAHVTVEDEKMDERRLLHACSVAIGDRFTPQSIEIMRP